MTKLQDLNNIIKEEKKDIKEYFKGLTLERKNIDDRIACFYYMKTSIDKIEKTIKEYQNSEKIRNVINA